MTTAYSQAVRDFDHAGLARLDAYPQLRQALNDIAHAADGVTLPEFLDAVRDMAATTPYGDMCRRCSRAGAEVPPLCWPHKATRKGEWLRCTYRCGVCGDVWECGYSVNLPAFI